jgi:hypothetical protein
MARQKREEWWRLEGMWTSLPARLLVAYKFSRDLRKWGPSGKFQFGERKGAHGFPDGSPRPLKSRAFS